MPYKVNGTDKSVGCDGIRNFDTSVAPLLAEP